MSQAQHKHWLYRESSKPKLWAMLAILLLLTILPELFIHPHGNFEQQGIHIDQSFGFHAWYGFITCALMVIAAKLLGLLLKRDDTYYDQPPKD